MEMNSLLLAADAVFAAEPGPVLPSDALRVPTVRQSTEYTCGAAALLAWAERWEDVHYVALVALDGTNAYFMDPSVLPGLARVPSYELPHRWHDYERDGRAVRRFSGPGIVIRGKTPATPPALTRMD